MTGRKPREAYVRAVIEQDGVEIIAGLEFRRGERGKLLGVQLRIVVNLAIVRLLKHAALDDDEVIAQAVEERIVAQWPDRAYFLEVGRDKQWIQIFQPWGVPRER